MAIVAPLGPTRGKARIYMDGTYLSTIDFARPTTLPRRLVYLKTWSASGNHRVTIRVVGGASIGVDAFAVIR